MLCTVSIVNVIQKVHNLIQLVMWSVVVRGCSGGVVVPEGPEAVSADSSRMVGTVDNRWALWWVPPPLTPSPKSN